MINVLNMIDLLAVAPFYVEIIVDAVIDSADPPICPSFPVVKLKPSERYGLSNRGKRCRENRPKGLSGCGCFDLCE